VDLGTTRLKVGLFDIEGRRCALGVRAFPRVRSASPDQAELPIATYWNLFRSALGEALASLPGAGRRVAAAGICSQAQTFACFDAKGRALAPALLWTDARAQDEARRLAQSLPSALYYRATGWPAVNPLLAAAKLAWLSAQRPQLMSRCRRVLFAPSYLAWRLTGEQAVDDNIAAMSGLYHLRRAAWWPRALQACRVDSAVLPRIIRCGETVGMLTSAAASALGLRRCPIVFAGNDQTAAALGAGISAHEAFLGLGTGLVAYRLIPAASPFRWPRPVRGPAPAPGMHFALLADNCACAALDWLVGLAGGRLSSGKAIARGLRAPPGANGARMNPHLRGRMWPEPRFDMRGALWNLGLSHRLDDILRAALEGIACAARELLSLLRCRGPVRVVGGGAQSDGWMQLFADLCGLVIERPACMEASVMGAALLAASRAGLVSVPPPAGSQWGRIQSTWLPDRRFRPTYDKVYDDYQSFSRLAPMTPR
jgi:xylulokinase